MRNGKLIISLLTMILVILLLLVLIPFSGEQTEVEESELSLSFSVVSGENRENIRCWENDDGHFYVFLPGFAEMDQVFAAPGELEITIGDVQLSENMPCASFSLDVSYPFVCIQDEEKIRSSISFVRSGNLPTLYIDVQSHDMEYIHMDKTHEESGRLRLYDADGKQLSDGTLASVKGRGNTTWDAEKKPYNLTLAEEMDLLGMGAANRWILLAEGHNAATVRNKIVYDFANTVGMPYSPDCRWVDLYLNGEYAGVYLLSERNEIHPERVDISPENSFVVSMESERLLNAQKLPFVLTEAERALRIRSASQSPQNLQEILQSVESAILAEDGVDPVSGKHWQELIDMDSWVRKYLVEEIFANPDGGSVSQYFYMDGSEAHQKVYAGPVWDYDYAMGGEDYWLRDHTAFYTMNCRDSRFSNFVSWFYPLYHTDTFYRYLTEVFEKDFLPGLQELMEDRLTEYGQYLAQASRVSQIRWSQPPDAWEEELGFIRAFLERRTAFLSDVWINDTEYHTVHMDIGRYYEGHFAVKPGGSIPEIPEYVLSDGIGWYNAETEEPFDISQPVYEDTFLYYKPAGTVVPMITIVPFAGIFAVLCLLVLLDRSRTKKNGRTENEPAKVN